MDSELSSPGPRTFHGNTRTPCDNNASQSIAKKFRKKPIKLGVLQGLIPQEPGGGCGGPGGCLLPSGVSLGPNGSFGGRSKLVLPSSAASLADSSKA